MARKHTQAARERGGRRESGGAGTSERASNARRAPARRARHTCRNRATSRGNCRHPHEGERTCGAVSREKRLSGRQSRAQRRQRRRKGLAARSRADGQENNWQAPTGVTACRRRKPRARVLLECDPRRPRARCARRLTCHRPDHPASRSALSVLQAESGRWGVYRKKKGSWIVVAQNLSNLVFRCACGFTALRQRRGPAEHDGLAVCRARRDPADGWRRWRCGH